MAAKNILQLFFHMDFFKNKKLTTNHLYVLYTLMAGIYYESYLQQWFRYFTKIYFIISVLDGAVNGLITSSRWKDVDVSLLMICASKIVIMNCVCLVILKSYYCREDIHKSFEAIDEYSKSYGDYDNGVVEEEEQRYPTIDYNKYLTFRYILPLAILYIFCFYGKLIIVCLTIAKSSDISTQYNYTYPVEYLTHVTWLEYILTYFLQTIFILPFCTTVTITLLIQILFSIIIRNQVSSFVNEIKLWSNLNTRFLGRLYKQEIEILEAETSTKNKTLKLSNISKERNSCNERFTNHTKKWIFRYQKLFTAMSLLKDYFGAISSLMLLGQTILCMGFAYISILAIGTKSVEYFFFIVLFIPALLIYCINGHLYDSMMEELQNEIYAMPWYYMPATQRKLIINFLSIVQRPCTLKSFGVYPITLNLYPRILMKMFSYLQIIRIMEAKLKT